MRLLRLAAVAFPLILLAASTSYGGDVRVYDVGHYPGGTWAEVRGINDSGLVVAWGDIPQGWTRPIGVPLKGRNAGEWFDLGTLGGERNDFMVMCMGVADTGMIVGHAALPGGTLPLQEPVHGFVWTAKAEMVDLGTLPGVRTWSLAYNVNRNGTIIVGWSSSGWFSIDSLPVVWTPKKGPGGLATAWRIQTLDMTGFEDLVQWYATNVNNSGQITGTAASADFSRQVGFLWNPLPGRRGWEIMALPVTPEFPNAYANDVNEKGEVVGFVAAADWSTMLPAVWKPANPGRTAYTVTTLATPPGVTPPWAQASGINNAGDIVGWFFDAWWTPHAARWIAGDPGFAEELPFPGVWSFALDLNSNGVAVGSYGSETIPENVAAVRLDRSAK